MNMPISGLKYDGEDEASAHTDTEVTPDDRITLLLQSVGNSIHPSIQVKIDNSSRHVQAGERRV